MTVTIDDLPYKSMSCYCRPATEGSSRKSFIYNEPVFNPLNIINLPLLTFISTVAVDVSPYISVSYKYL